MKTSFWRQATEDKLILQSLLYEPDKQTNNLILHIHGMSGNFYENRFLDSMAKTFTENNWAFLTPNTRGHDFIADFPIEGDEEKYKRIGNTFEIFSECVFDIKCWMDFAEKQGYDNIALQGHSLGCSKVVYYLFKTSDKRINKLILASQADMVGFGLESKNNTEMMKLATKLMKQGKGEEILPEKFEEWNYISAQTKLDFHTPGNPIDIFNTHNEGARSLALESIKIPTFAFMGNKNDSYLKHLTPEKSLEIVRKKANNCPQFDTAIVDGAPHSYFGHEEEVADLIISWLNK